MENIPVSEPESSQTNTEIFANQLEAREVRANSMRHPANTECRKRELHSQIRSFFHARKPDVERTHFEPTHLCPRVPSIVPASGTSNGTNI
jgi:hypothetical protein